MTAEKGRIICVNYYLRNKFIVSFYWFSVIIIDNKSEDYEVLSWYHENVAAISNRILTVMTNFPGKTAE